MVIKKLDSLGQAIFEQRYSHPGEKGYADRCRTIAKHIASCENEEEKEKWIEKFYETLNSGDFVPGGRIIYGAGRNKQNLLNCFAAGTLVYTRHGFKPIESISIGEEVLTHKNRFRKVTHSFSQKKDKLIGIKVYGLNDTLELKVTPDHKIMTPTGYVEAKDLRVSDYVETGMFSDHSNFSDTIDVYQYVDKHKYDLVDNKISKPNKMVGQINYSTGEVIGPYNGKSINSEIPITKKFGLWAGYYLSEGCSPTHGNGIKFTFNSSELNYCNEVLQLGLELFGIEGSLSESKAGEWVDVIFNSTILNQFHSNYFGKFFNKKVIPWQLMESSDDVKEQILIGLIRGDGSVYNRKNSSSASLTLSNPSLVYQAYLIAKSLKYDCSYALKTSVKKDSHSPSAVLYILAHKTNYDLINKIENSVLSNSSNRIREIRELNGETEVWDITVEEDHSLVANGIVASNCYAIEPEDSVESIGKTIQDMYKISCGGGGIGFNFSKIRPKGDDIGNVKNSAPGSVSVMKMINEVGNHVKAGKNRRCLAIGTRVLVKDKGFTEIENVKIGDLVSTKNGWKEVVDHLDQGIQKIIRVWHQDGYLDCTENHRIAVATNTFGSYEWVEAKYLKPEDRLLFVRSDSNNKDAQSNLPSYKYTKPSHSTNYKDIKIPVLDEGISWLFGVIAGDGHVNETCGQVYVACHSDDVDHIIQVKEQLERFGVEAKIIKRELENCTEVKVYSRQLTEYLALHLKKANTPIRVPKFIKEANLKVRLAFVAGITDSDGCVSNRPLRLLSSVYIDFAKDIQSLLYSCGIESRLSTGKIYPSRAGWQPLHHLNLITLKSKELFKNSTSEIRIKSIRDYERPQNSNGFPSYFYEDMPIPKGTWSKQNSQMAIDTHERLFGDSRIVPIKFLRVEDLGTEAQTYDISVEDEHCFIAEGILVHNTALMAELNVDHPDLLEFLHVKLDLNQLTNFNISVAITDEFIDACENNREWSFKFNNRVYNVYQTDRVSPNGNSELINIVALSEEDALLRAKNHLTVHPDDKFLNLEKVNFKAIELWDKIWKNAVHSGDPGIFNLSLTNRYTNMSYFLSMNQSNPCHSGSSYLLTDKGFRTFKELYDGMDKVKVVQDTRVSYIGPEKDDNNPIFWKVNPKDEPKFEINQASEVFLTKVHAETVRVSTVCGLELILTPDHHVATMDRGMVMAKDLLPSDKVLVGNTPIKDITSINKNSSDFKLGYLYGLFVGDGHLNTDKNTVSLQFWDKDLGEALVAKSITKELFDADDESFKDWSSNNTTRKISEGYILPKTSRNSLIFESTYLRRKFECLGLITFDNKFVNGKLPHLSSEFLSGFISGLIFTDGTINTGRDSQFSIRIGSVNKKLLQELQILLLEYGIFGKIYLRKKSSKRLLPDGIGGYKEYDCKDYFEIIFDGYSRNLLYNLAQLKTHKKEKYDVTFASKKKAQYSNKWYAKVKEVVPNGFEDVFCIKEDKRRTINVNGIINRRCGEIPLDSYANCCLGHINLSNMLTSDNSDVDWKKLARTIRAGVRFLDNVLTVNHYPIPECKIAGERSRRIGLGTLGLHHMLIKLGIKYGSDKCLEFLDRLYATIRDEAYLASMYIAREKGSFPEFDAKKYLAEDFAKTLPARIRMLIREHGIRNAVMLTAAPTGTISMVHGTSTGIEPIFAPMYKRRYREGSAWRETIVLDPMFKEALENGSDASHIVGAYDIKPEQHMAVQAVIQRHIDNAISKTINLPKDADYKEISKMALKYAPYLKGMTIYRAGSKALPDTPEPLEAIPLTEDAIAMARSIIKSENAKSEVSAPSCRIGDGSCGE